MNSLTDLREVVDVVIGVDTHVHTHSAAVINTATGGVLDEITVEATAQGYVDLVEFANNQATLRAWAIEGTGGHGAGLSVTSRPGSASRWTGAIGPVRRHGAKSDPLDAIRAAPRGNGRPKLGTPRAGGRRQALSVLFAARAVSRSMPRTKAQQQVFSWGSPHRNHPLQFRDQKLPAMINTARGSAPLFVRVETTGPWWRSGPWHGAPHPARGSSWLLKTILRIIGLIDQTCSKSSASDPSSRPQAGGVDSGAHALRGCVAICSGGRTHLTS